MIKKSYDCVFSVGEACLCAGILSKLDLRYESFPFDWVSDTILEDRIQILLNDFNDFINKEDLEKIGQRDMPEPRDIYLNHRTNMIFNHDFPLGERLDITYPQVKEKYNRRIKRLLSILEHSQNVLMVYMELPKSSHKVDTTTLQKLLDQINDKFKTTQIDMLYIAHDENMTDGESECKQISNNLFIGKCFNQKRESDKDYNGNPNNAKLVLKGVSRKKKFVEWIIYKIKKVMKKLIKIFYVKKLKKGEIYMRILGIKIKCK